MSRIVQREIDMLSTDEYGVPLEFTDQGELRRVAYIVDEWSEMGSWIDGEGERRVYRVVTGDNAVLDLERAELPPDKDADSKGVQPKFTIRWSIYRVWD